MGVTKCTASPCGAHGNRSRDRSLAPTVVRLFSWFVGGIASDQTEVCLSVFLSVCQIALLGYCPTVMPQPCRRQACYDASWRKQDARPLRVRPGTGLLHGRAHRASQRRVHAPAAAADAAPAHASPVRRSEDAGPTTQAARRRSRGLCGPVGVRARRATQGQPARRPAHAQPGRGRAPAQGAVDAGGSAEREAGLPARSRNGARALGQGGPRTAARTARLRADGAPPARAAHACRRDARERLAGRRRDAGAVRRRGRGALAR